MNLPGSHTALIARARRKLARWPHVTYEATRETLYTAPPHDGGFAIHLRSGRNAYIVRFDGWTRTFERDADALDCMELGLSDSCRLAVTCRGGHDVGWTLEVREYGLWVPHHRTRRWLAPFWRRPRLEYRQNRVIASEPG